MSLDVTDSVGLIKLKMEPLLWALDFSCSRLEMPYFSGLVSGVGGKVIFGEPSLILRDVELSLSDLEIEFDLTLLDKDFSLDLTPSSSSIIWKSPNVSRPFCSDLGEGS